MCMCAYISVCSFVNGGWDVTRLRSRDIFSDSIIRTQSNSRTVLPLVMGRLTGTGIGDVGCFSGIGGS